jgi:NAD+ kinase
MQLGLVVHPSRPIERVLEQIEAWAQSNGAAVGQVPVPGQARQVAEPVAAEACDVLVSIGGDGTTLHALHAGARAGKPVLGVACGSVGMLTTVTAVDVASALDRVAAGEWAPQPVPGLDVIANAETLGSAANDVVVVRDGPGQVVIAVTIDDVLYARMSGDGLVVATAIGSSAYTMAAGGPILAPGAEGMVVTPLAPYGGSVPPLVAGEHSRVGLTLDPSYAGVRMELDGRPLPLPHRTLEIVHRPHLATLVALPGDEPRLTGLRRRGLVLDGPRVVARDRRDG